MGDVSEERSLEISSNIVQSVAPKLVDEDGYGAAP